ncbi:MAG: S16 family serine protease [Acidimicrobiia bacterium]
MPVEPAEPGRPTRHRGLRLVAVLLVVLVVGTITAANVRVAYYAVAPGGTFDTRVLVSVAEGREFAARGEVAFPTVSSGRATALEAFTGWLDGDIDVVHEERVRPPDVDDDELRDINLRLMAGSKEKAIGVAFERLGYDAIHGEGAQVVQVVDGAAAAGLLVAGDVIVAVGGTPITLDAEAVSAVRALAPGVTARLVVRGPQGATRPVDVVLGANPSDPSVGYLGVSLQTAGVRIEPPFEVDIDSDRIGGPSAGLAFTLEVLDRLTAGELTGGRRVAATGTMELDGRVGDVGGVRQKTAAVVEGGYDLFLVPRRELAEARRRAGSKVKVVAVDDLDDALRALAELGGNGLELGLLAAG